ncbi:hypothetical protein [Bradyrhizobium sp. URHC0002]
MHDLRQRRCPIIRPMLRCPEFADVRESSLAALSIGVKNYRKKIKSIAKSVRWIVEEIRVA